MVSDTLVLTVIYDRARTVLELINMETQWPEQGIGFVFPLAVLPLSVIFFHCHSASDFVLRLLPSLCNMAAAASSITPHTTVYKARKENIFFFFFLREESVPKWLFLVSHWLEMDQRPELITPHGRGEWNYHDWLRLTQILLSEPSILEPTWGSTMIRKRVEWGISQTVSDLG